jgi:hypothetical protein
MPPALTKWPHFSLSPRMRLPAFHECFFPVPRAAAFIFRGARDCERVDSLDKPSREENNGAKPH